MIEKVQYTGMSMWDEADKTAYVVTGGQMGDRKGNRTQQGDIVHQSRGSRMAPFFRQGYVPMKMTMKEAT